MTPLTVTGDTITIAILSITTIIGFVLAYIEYSSREKVVKDYDDKLSSTIKSYEDKIENISKLNEEDLLQSEELIKGRIKDIEEVHRSVLDDQNVTLELYESYIKNFDAAITLTDKKLKDLDNKGVFSSDDEIGFFFRSILDLQSILNRFKIEKEVLDKELLNK